MLERHKFVDLYKMSSGISTKPEQAGHGGPFLSFSTVFKNYFLPDELPDRMNTSAKEQQTYSVKKGDIFLTRTSETIDELGMSCVALKDYPGATYSGFSKRLRPREQGRVDERFIGFYLRSALFRKTMTNNAVMTLRASLNEEIFSYLELLLPDYETQQHIGALLHQLESKITINNRINAELEAMAKLLYDYWFVQFDFPNAKGKPYKSSGGAMVYNKELKREVPEGWEVKGLGVFGEFRNGINYDPKEEGDTDARIINVRNISSATLFVSASDLDHIRLKESAVKKYLVTDDTILIARSGIPGATRLIQDYVPNTIYCGFIISFELNKPVFKNMLFFHLKKYEQAMTNQSAGTILQNVNQDTLKGIRVTVPPPKETGLIDEFNKIIKPIFDQIATLSAQNQELTTLRDWLLPMLMNGQVVVGEAEEKVGLAMAAEAEAVYRKKRK